MEISNRRGRGEGREGSTEARESRNIQVLQEARCTGARFALKPGRGRGVCRSRPANTQINIKGSECV
jgi:hypothetical protein